MDAAPDTVEEADTAVTADVAPDVSTFDTAEDPDSYGHDGAFLAPCVENDDCNSGWCIETDLGSVCTRSCESNCPLDWRCVGVSTGGADLAFLCQPSQSRLCLPCTVDRQCSGGYCLADDAGANACTLPCSEEQPCPGGFSCVERASTLEPATEPTMQCVSDTGRCDCTAKNEGEERPCVAENDFGRCWGTEQCDGDLGWSTCTASIPAAETCDGADNDCDGFADEDVEAPADACEETNANGTCLGRWACGGPEGWVCAAQTPAPELCDFKDNDCNGVVDDPYRDPSGELYVDDENCGVCNNSCVGKIAFATATSCALVEGAPACIATACTGGYFIPEQSQQACVPIGGGTDCSSCLGDLACGDLTDGQCTALEDGLYCTRGCTAQEDCSDGFVCDGGRCVPPSRSCTCLASNDGNTRTCAKNNAFGTCFGVQQCAVETGWSICDAPVPADEVCDGVDNDCDGQVDEVPHDPETCSETNAFGTCTATWSCHGLGGWTCDAAIPAAETCNFRDDDCDGLIDDGFRDPDSGQYVDDDNCGSCNISCAGALPNATAACRLTDAGAARCEVVTCAPGFYQEGPLACLPANADVCRPCTSDANCPGGRCVALDEGMYCVNQCEQQGDCQDGYNCTSVDGVSVCAPDTGSCTCSTDAVGIFRGCSVAWNGASGPYECFGTQECTETGWSECAPSGEQCNLLDDDCDGQTDEDFLVDGDFRTDTDCGQCGNNCTLLTFPGGAGVCNASVDPPTCSVSCGADCYDLNANPSDGCECCNPQPIDLPDPDGIDANCDGIDGQKGEAIFVAKSGSDANSGLFGAPKLTLQAGIDAAVALGKRDVYVATGVYKEAVVLAAGVGVYGGYSGDFVHRNTILYEVALLGPAPTAATPGAVNAVGISGGVAGTTVWDGFSVNGNDAKVAGQTSIAIYVADCDATLLIAHNRVYGGAGGKGMRGFDGTDGADAPPGGDGIMAFDVFDEYGVAEHGCAAANGGAGIVSLGGDAGVQACGALDTSGGAGGLRECPAWNDLTSETALATEAEAGVTAPSGGGSGGAAGRDAFHQAFQCLGYDTYDSVEGRDGGDGQIGAGGAAGAGCSDADGSVAGGRWQPGAAGDGGTGLAGRGGGGGGSGGGAYVHTSCDAKGFNYDNFGGSGGGGGAGGCSGTGGGAATSGGAAFAVFVTFAATPTSVPTLADNAITGGFGGDGGDGGNAGVGGSGGGGGFGGAGGGGFNPPDPTYPSFRGGKGGKGGNGGAGGGGGGGCGGPAFGVYAAGAAPALLAAWKTDNTFPVAGQGGGGGVGGFSLGAKGGEGASGASGTANF